MSVRPEHDVKRLTFGDYTHIAAWRMHYDAESPLVH